MLGSNQRLRLVETEARGQGVTGQVKKSTYMQGIPRSP